MMMKRRKINVIFLGAAQATTPEDDEEEVSSEDIIKIKKKKVAKDVEVEEKKEHINVVFIGHVDAGKSTIGGQIMALTGMVDKRTLEKYQREACEKSRESWYLSWALDTNQEGLILLISIIVLLIYLRFYCRKRQRKDSRSG